MRVESINPYLYTNAVTSLASTIYERIRRINKLPDAPKRRTRFTRYLEHRYLGYYWFHLVQRRISDPTFQIDATSTTFGHTCLAVSPHILPL